MRSKNIVKPTNIIIFCVTLLFLLAMILIWFCNSHYRINWNAQSYIQTNQPLSNPYRGWYHIYGYTLDNDTAITQENILASCNDDVDSTLALVEINLRKYKTTSISDAALQQLDLILSAWELTDKQLILRFLYDWDGNAMDTEPEDISVIMEHMSQVAPVINRHASSIFTLQGIFIGNYGEMHNTHFTSPKSMSQLMKQLAKVTDPSIFLSVRTPAQWRELSSSFTPLTSLDAFSSTLSSRMGLFNDGMLGSANDCGTYGDTSLTNATSYSDKGTRVEELRFQEQLCLYVPNGGEVIIDNPYNDIDMAIEDLNQMHISYLNSIYDPAVLSKWKDTIYQGSNLFNGCTGYEYISSHLGYRYVLQSTDLAYQFLNRKATLTIMIENTGFANCYKQFEVSLGIMNPTTQQADNISIPADTRTWHSGEVTKLTVPLNIASYQSGDYELYLSVIDPVTKLPILFANQNYNSSFGYLLGRLQIAKLTE